VNYDLDYYYDVAKFNENYIQSIWHNARKNLKIAFKNELSFRKCASAAEMRKSYEIIQKNREVQGYPLKMSLDQIAETQNVIEVDSFIVSKNGLDIASAIVFRVAKDIVQVIYWGNILEYSDLKGMNFLSFKIFEYYSQRNIRFVDVGPATENSLPNYGLCEFKESIGCNIMPRYKIQKKVS
jgi:lipid II:glycine glycyltransferase (peptidoglycan interpeptide bridge formation enzyme)